MDDSDSGLGSISSIISTRTSSSMSGDDRSAAGSRNSAQSLSEVSSPAPQQQQQQQQPQSNSSASHQDSIRVWRENDQATQIRHIQSVQHHPLMMTPPGHPGAPPFPLPMSILFPPPIYATEMWSKQQQQQQQQQQGRYEEEKHVRDRREMEYREIERQKEMDRERERVERHQQQQQQQHERDRERERQAQQQQEKQMTEQAVTKHFEESLRRAKEKNHHQQYMRSSWPINSIPQHQQTISHLVQQSHVSPSQAPSNQHQISSSSPVDDRRRTSGPVEHERIYVDRDREIEKERARESERERDRYIKQQHEKQQRAFYNASALAISTGIQQQQRAQPKNEYIPSQQPQSQSHRSITIGVPPQSKSNEKIIPEAASGGGGSRILMDPSGGNYKIYSNYNLYPTPQQPSSSSSSSSSSSFHKDLNKSKSDITNSLPNPPPLMSDIKQSSGVIVKHDTNLIKSSPIQIVHSSTKQPTTHYTAKGNPIHGHPVYEYRPQQQQQQQQQPPPQTSDRYKSQSVTVLPSSQSYHNIQQSHTPPSQQSVAQQPVHYSTSNVSSVASKPKLPTPAPIHFYAKPPGSAGIVSGIPVCRSQDVSVYVTKSSSPSAPYQSQTQLYGPPPAHSRTPHEYRLHQQSNVVGGGSPGVVGSIAKPTLSHSIPQHHHHQHHLSTSPPTQIPVVAPHSLSRSPGLIPPNVGTPPHSNQIIGGIQTQPLDLGVSSRDDNSNGPPKRKGTPIHHPIGSPIPMEIKKKKMDVQNTPLELRTMTTSPHVTASPTLISSNNPSSAMDVSGSGATGGLQNLTKNANGTGDIIDITITTNPVASKSPNNSIDSGSPGETGGNNPVTINLSLNSSSTSSTPPIVAPAVTPQPPQSTTPGPQHQQQFSSNLSILESDGTASVTTTTTRFSSTNSSPSQSPGIGQTTPAKSTTSEPDKSSSPAPKSSAPRHLKKAWLQRHTGEDVEDRTGIIGSGSCVKLPLTTAPAGSNSVNNTTGQAASLNPPVHSLHTVGSMAVNSINKSKTNIVGNKVTSQQHPKKTLVSQSSFSSGGKDNGHNSDSDLEENSSSSDQDRTVKNSVKRKSPKVKRRKGGTATRKPVDDPKKKKVVAAVSESDKDSDSEHDSISDKDSDSGTSTSQGTKKTSNGARRESGLVDSKEPRKRGRRPKTLSKDESLKKKLKEDQPPQSLKDPFRKPPISQLKKTGDSFLQDGPCFEVAPKLAKCRECRWTPNQRSKNTPNIFCRFYAFRRLRYTKNGQLAIAGFSDPHKDPSEDDLKLWMPDGDNPPTDLDLQMSRFLLSQVGDQFCDLLQQEKEAMAEHMSDDKTIAWKRVVQGVREMCDVCETTLFNYHWACGKCGFVVCIDCYKDRKSGSVKIWGETGKDRDDCSWLLCTNRQSHEQEKLMLTQIIAGDSLQILGRRNHEARALWEIPQYCGCALSEQPPKATNGICKEFIKSLIKNEVNGVKKEPKPDEPVVNGVSKQEDSNSALSWLADVAIQSEGKKNGRNGDETDGNDTTEDVKDAKHDDSTDDSTSSDDEAIQQKGSTLRELLIRPSGKPNGSRANSPAPKQRKSKLDTVEEIISCVIESAKQDDPIVDSKEEVMKFVELKHFVGKQRKFRNQLPVRIMTLGKSSSLYPNIPHVWLCDGKLLRLLDPNNTNNYKLFQEQWKRGQPVLISDVSKNLNMDIWHPDSFTRDFGDDKNDLINCLNGNLLPKQPMRKFWEGFEHITKRLKDDKGNPMLLKLKDWPPGEDFAEMLPTRFNDLMKSLPLGDYTQRNGRLNLASRLPDCFVRPDLGPKMYNAYGSAIHASKGTTNLHLDISDAVNVMVYIGIPKDGPDENYMKTEAYKAIDEAGCDILMRRRVRDKCETPGAIWHIYAAQDADKIRDLLNKVAIERGERLEPNHDPIHDQSWYLDGPLRERLYREYGVEGYPIAQCLGDAVFIPAGAPHQVRNLHNCIKVAEDFVSPENVYHCFHLTHEFRDLSDTHSNHEDKLQIKNIIYHAIKDALACLSYILGQRVAESQGLVDVQQTPGSKTRNEIKQELLDGENNDA